MLHGVEFISSGELVQRFFATKTSQEKITSIDYYRAFGMSFWDVLTINISEDWQHITNGRTIYYSGDTEITRFLKGIGIFDQVGERPNNLNLLLGRKINVMWHRGKTMGIPVITPSAFIPDELWEDIPQMVLENGIQEVCSRLSNPFEI
jgi:hypothetical protein